MLCNAHDILTNAPIGIFTSTPEGRFLYTNPAMADMYGYASAQEMIESVTDITTKIYVNPEDRRRLFECFDASETAKDFETLHQRKDGSTFWISESVHLVRDKKGNITRLHGFVTDISARKIVEQREKESEERFRLMFMNAPMPYQSLDEQGNFLDINQTFLDVLGYSREELVGKNFGDILHPDWSEHFKENFPKFKAVCEIMGVEFEMVKKDGSTILVFFNGKIQHDDQGRFLRTHCIFQDVTDQKKTEEALRESEKRYRTLFERTVNPIAVIDVTGNYIDTNEAALQFLECSREELLKKNVIDFIPPDNDKMLEKIMPLWETGGVLEREYFVNGKIKTLVLTLTPGTWHGQSVVFCTGTDITERKQAEKALRVSEERFRLSMEATSDGVWDWNIQTNHVYYSTGYTRMLGYEPNEVPQHVKTWLDLIHPEDMEKAFKANKECIENRQESFAVEFRMQAKNGDWIWILGRGRAVSRDPSGQATRMIGTHQDITERKRAGEALRKERLRLDNIIRGTNVATWEWNVQSGEHVIDERWAEIIGYTLKELEPITIQTWEKNVHPDDQKEVGKQLDLHFTGKIPFLDAEYRMRHKSGHWVWVLDRGQVVTRTKDGKPLMMYGTLCDITDRIRDKEALFQNNQQLQRALDEKDKFFSIIAHDLKSPLAGFMVLTRMLADEFNTLLIKDLRQMISELAQATETLHSLLKNLLEWSLLQRGMLTYDPVISLLADSIENTIELFQTTAGNKNVFLQSELDQNLLVFADKQMLDTILRNLVSNAIKFSMGGGIVIISAFKDQDMAVVTVQDTGTGIDEEHLSNLFILTRKKSLKGTQGELGTGLGLLLCKDFIVKHGGRIWAESRLGKGSTFLFALPLADK
ncbi:PAS domain S-box protein [Desulfonatronum parangueonense]